ncbi:hypothetical protein B0T25DRAFT_300208 [Lasiosphaeria hispida]|uniref:Uncharacterized protein n=1 Tax=Lasiosphaeria hispida TaxID=260671 RepID=A0AAJ0H8J7_9PEZI|nr:hypothetical protein B0T25DRAFT_300208 [Lasiosphaeria hispida]
MGNIQSGVSGLSANEIGDLTVRYTAGTVAIYAFPILPLLILWGISLRSTHRKGDPARGAFAWIKTLFPLYILSLLLYTIGRAMYLFAVHNPNVVPGRTKPILKALDFLTLTARYLEDIADILLLVALIELGSGFLISLYNGPSKRAKLARYATFALGLAFFMITSAYFALSAEYWYRYHGWWAAVQPDGSSAPPYNTGPPHSNPQVGLLGNAFNVLLWVAVLPIVGYAAYVVHKTKHAPHLGQSAILFLVATLLDFFRLTVGMVTSALYELRERSITRPLSLTYITQPTLNTVPWFVLLVLLFVIGIRKNKGLWSSARLDEISQAEARRLEAAEVKAEKPSWKEKFKKPTKKEWQVDIVQSLATPEY